MLRQKDFIYEIDSVIGTACYECTNYYHEELDECIVCGNKDLVFETSHKSLQCESCNYTFDTWENVYTSKKEGDNKVLCGNCFNKLEK